jgi:hypothetical protein
VTNTQSIILLIEVGFIALASILRMVGLKG